MCLPRRKIRKIKKNKIHPYKINPDKGGSSIIGNEHIQCGGCKQFFSLRSNELKIHCNRCEKFFHCKIAGKCDGKDCCITKTNGEIHKASYCYDCMGLNTKERKLCKDCFK